MMNSTPIFLNSKEREKAIDILVDRKIEAIPIVDDQLCIKDIVFWNDKFDEKLNHFDRLDNSVIIMAGGKGTRLDPYTKILPKPLIPIGDVPIVERIMNRFNDYGCKNFVMSVNYKKDMIKAYFKDICKNYDVEYIEEDKPLGTAGSLTLLRGKLDDTFFVSNCDILIEGNYSDMLKYHKDNNYAITLITSLKHFTIPYGVISLNDSGEVYELREKPEYNYLVNTGMYILEPEVLKDVPENEMYHITDLINKYMKEGKRVGVYPVSDQSWMDMGQIQEMELMIERLGLK